MRNVALTRIRNVARNPPWNAARELIRNVARELFRNTAPEPISNAAGELNRQPARSGRTGPQVIDRRRVDPNLVGDGTDGVGESPVQLGAHSRCPLIVARDRCSSDLTVPGRQPRESAICASVRSR
jgi:hypothetical protein